MRFDDTAKIQAEKSAKMLADLKTTMEDVYILKMPNNPELIRLMKNILRATSNGTTIEQVQSAVDHIHIT